MHGWLLRALLSMVGSVPAAIRALRCFSGRCSADCQAACRISLAPAVAWQRNIVIYSTAANVIACACTGTWPCSCTVTNQLVLALILALQTQHAAEASEGSFWPWVHQALGHNMSCSMPGGVARVFLYLWVVLCSCFSWVSVCTYSLAAAVPVPERSVLNVSPNSKPRMLCKRACGPAGCGNNCRI